ncbi:aldehyde dehydrogenase [Caballeronia sp. dw_19]|uniref:aldehyde dehydrogenase n=1 Tax=Caballeronia sp. dw_19 TaxID=2719791 RepID=UPI001C4A2987|nr:aldehyde dehydrogenase [Caballeronia sp. dw_19]
MSQNNAHYIDVDAADLRTPGSASAPSIRKYRNYIAGQWCDPLSDDWFGSVNPADGKVWAHVPKGGAKDAARAVQAARSAFASPAWRALTATARGELLYRVAAVFESRIEELAHIETRDNGKRLAEVIPQLRYLPTYLRYFAGLADKIEGAVIPVDVAGVFNFTRHEPLGVVVAITPWNSPLMLAIWKLAPALAAGNTVVLKPSEHASISSLELARVFEDAGMPPGVVNVVTGWGFDVGDALVRHPDVAAISFTGSEIGGQTIAAAAAVDVKRVTLELGGKSPQLVFADANLDDAVNGVASGMFSALGQSCIAGSRLLVHASIHDEFVERLVALMRNVRIGDPCDPATQIGPVATQAQYQKVLQFIDDAKSEGARCVLGGGPATEPRCQGGWFVEPTIFTDVKPQMTLFREEVFGPVLAVSRFDDDAQATLLANDTRYGLAAGIWTQDMSRAFRLSEQIQAGTIYINSYRHVSMMSPVGGFKHSGYGRENGIEAIKEFQQVKSVWIGLQPVPNAFPAPAV